MSAPNLSQPLQNDDPFGARRAELSVGPWQRIAAGVKEEAWRIAVKGAVEALARWAKDPTKAAPRNEALERPFLFAVTLRRAGQIDRVMPLRSDTHWSQNFKTSRAYHRDRTDLARWMGQVMAHAPYAPSPEHTSIERTPPMRIGAVLMGNWASWGARRHDRSSARAGGSSGPEWRDNFLLMAKAMDPVTTPWMADRIYRTWTAQRSEAEAFLNGWGHETKILQGLAPTVGVGMSQTTLPAECRSFSLTFPWVALNLLTDLEPGFLSEKAEKSLAAMEKLMDFRKVNTTVIQGLFSARDLRALTKVAQSGRDNPEVAVAPAPRRKI